MGKVAKTFSINQHRHVGEEHAITEDGLDIAPIAAEDTVTGQRCLYTPVPTMR